MIIELPPNLPVGVRFHPTDQELITRYLRPKILRHHFDDAIAEINLCDWEPWELPHKSKIKSNDRMWWFMCGLEYKHSNSRRSKRTTKTGFWKITGQERTIKDEDSKACIGKKRTLVFHSGPTPGKRTNWVMQEYYLDPELVLPHMSAPYVICRLKKKTDEKVDTPEGERGQPSGETISDLENSGPIAAIHQLHDQTEANHESDLPYGGLHLTYDDIKWMLSDDSAVGNELLNYESEERPDEFVNGLIVDPDEIYLDETARILLSDSSLSTSLKRSYFTDAPNGSDTDAEGVSTRYVQTLESSSPFDLPTSSKRVRHMRVVMAPSQLLRTSAMSEHCGQENVVSVSNPLYKEEASSSNISRPDEMFSMMSIKQAAEPPKHVDVRGGGRQKRIQIQIQTNSPSAATSSNKGKEASKHVVATADLPRKDKQVGESRNGGKEVERSDVEKRLESAGCESSASKWKTIFTFAETSSVSGCDSRPRSVYWFNAIIGTALFVIFVRELIVFGSW